MQVLHVISTLDPSTGGPPAVAARLAAAQIGQGARATLAAYSTPDIEPRVARSLAGIPCMDRVRLVRIAPERGRLARMCASGAAGVLRTLVPEHTVVHLHGVWDPILRVASRIARRAGVPYVVTPHGMLDPWSLGQSAGKRLKKRLALALAYRRMLSSAVFLHTLNRDERDLLAPLNLKSPAAVIPNGVFLDEFRDLPDRNSFRRARPELGDDPYVLFLSRLHFKKGLDYLADAFAAALKSVPAARLVVAGPDDGALVPFRDQCARLGVAGRVHVVGPLYGPDKLAALRGASCFCLPSRQEGFSMAITESLACSVPVVISRECHFPEVEEAGAGIVTPLEPAAVARGLAAILSDPALAAAMGSRGRQLVEARYTWPVVASRMLGAYANPGSVADDAVNIRP